MTTSQRNSRPEFLWQWLLGSVSLCYAIVAAQWHYPVTILTLTVLVLIIELFPIRMGKINFTFCFPILYTMGILTGFETTGLLSIAVLAIVHLILHRALRVFLINSVHRLLSLLAAGFSVRLLDLVLPIKHDLGYYLIHLMLSTVVFTTVSTLLVVQVIVRRLRRRANIPLVVRWGVVNVGGCFLYDGLMLVLASDPKLTSAGVVGTLFFYLPLATITIVVHLITNLTRAKSSLETLFAVSRSINQQVDLPTVLRQIIFEANRLVQGQGGLLYLVQEDGSLVCEVGTSDDLLRERLAPGNGLVGTVAQTGEPLLITDVMRDARFDPQGALPGTRSLLIVPILIDDQVAGVISICKKESHTFVADDLKMMPIFASHASVAIKNALYMEEREKRLLLEERNRLAREIHDGLAQDLASMLLRAEMMKRIAPPVAHGEINELQEMLRKTASTVRHSIYALRPQPYSHIGLVPAMRTHLQEVATQSKMNVHFDAQPTREPLPPPIANTVFQILTESVQNAVKHAKAQDLFVTLEMADNVLRLIIRDNGIGFHFGQAILGAAARRSFGIENLHHLADQVGGALDFMTSPGQGTMITLEIPLEEERTTHGNSRTSL